jgi:hypothetical protein
VVLEWKTGEAVGAGDDGDNCRRGGEEGEQAAVLVVVSWCLGSRWWARDVLVNRAAITKGASFRSVASRLVERVKSGGGKTTVWSQNGFERE